MTSQDLNQRKVLVERKEGYWRGYFNAMASPCDLLLACESEQCARELTRLAAEEAWRIERKYSRYRQEGVVSTINRSKGIPVPVDEETGQLFDFAYQCYKLSDGLFDITSGVLRRVWRFDGSDNLPSKDSVKSLLPFVGLNKAEWKDGLFSLPEGMEIDFGGIGKEYAVDRTLSLLLQQDDIPVLVNYGGDIATNRERLPGMPWLVGIEKPGSDAASDAWVEIKSGGLATSGDAQRYLLKKGIRYSHVLNPKTGWPVEHAPRSVTVAAPTCTQAGILATMAMLQGIDAEHFLDEQNTRCWVIR